MYPESPLPVWEELQSSTRVNFLLGADADDHPTDAIYLAAVAEAYKTAKSWDTRRQVLSVIASKATYRAVVKYIPGLSHYKYTAAKVHRLQYGPAAPVPQKHSPRLQISREQLDHFLSFITSPHLVQDLPFGEKRLKLSNGQYVDVPNVIRIMIPQRIVRQYTQYCREGNFKPLGERTMLRILAECSASVRKSLQGLDYFAAEGGRAFDDLTEILDTTLANGASSVAVTRLQELLKAAKLYLKGDYKVRLLRLLLMIKTTELSLPLKGSNRKVTVAVCSDMKMCM